MFVWRICPTSISRRCRAQSARAAVASAGSATSTGCASGAGSTAPTCSPRSSPISKRAAPDHIAVTGDLVNLSLSKRVRAGARLARTARRRRPTSRSCRAITTPTCAPAASFAAQHWGDYMRGDDGESFPFVRRRGPLALIGLSTSLPTLPLAATGRLARRTSSRGSASVLAALGARRLFRVVLIHHPPVEGAHHFRRLLDAAALRDVLRKHGAELVLHGHHHELVAGLAAGPANSASRWSACRRPRARRGGTTTIRPATISTRSTARPARGAARWSRAASTRTTAGSSRSGASR